MIEIPPSQRKTIAGLFAGHIGLRTVVNGMLQGRFGEAWADAAEGAEVACLSIGPFTCVGGDWAHPAADDLIGQWSDTRVVLVADDGWQRKVTTWEGSQTTVVERSAFSNEHLEKDHLESLAAKVPDGFAIRAIDCELAERITTEVHKNLIPDLFWTSAEDFIRQGFGYCAVANERIEAGVTSALLSNDAAGIQINTNQANRGKGLATSLGATFLLDCLERDLAPHWDSGDPTSCHIAEKLGYELVGVYPVLEWKPGSEVG